MSAECARLAVDLERLLPKVDAEDLDEDRRIAFAEAALSKIAALETAADGDAAVLAQVATYEEAMLGVIDGLRPPRRKEGAEARRARQSAGLRRRAVPAAQSDSESDPEEEPPQNEADSLQRELETMTARLKASSLAVHEKLREQSKAMERLDDATSQNQNAVSKERTALDARAAARTRTLLQALAALVAVLCRSWGRTFLLRCFRRSSVAAAVYRRRATRTFLASTASGRAHGSSGEGEVEVGFAAPASAMLRAAVFGARCARLVATTSAATVARAGRSRSRRGRASARSWRSRSRAARSRSRASRSPRRRRRATR